MTHLALPLVATGWKNTLVNDSDGNTILLMPNGHKSLEAVQEATALFAAAPEMLAALQMFIDEYGNGGLFDGTEIEAVVLAAIAKAVQSSDSPRFIQ